MHGQDDVDSTVSFTERYNLNVRTNRPSPSHKTVYPVSRDLTLFTRGWSFSIKKVRGSFHPQVFSHLVNRKFRDSCTVECS
jgi:hypothetical protein